MNKPATMAGAAALVSLTMMLAACPDPSGIAGAGARQEQAQPSPEQKQSSYDRRAPPAAAGRAKERERMVETQIARGWDRRDPVRKDVELEAMQVDP